MTHVTKIVQSNFTILQSDCTGATVILSPAQVNQTLKICSCNWQMDFILAIEGTKKNTRKDWIYICGKDYSAKSATQFLFLALFEKEYC